jgi:signal transduction histidine kinase
MTMAKREASRGTGETAEDDGTSQLLRWGGWMVGTGLAAAVLLQTVLGGYSRTGASSNLGWFALIVALMCIPFGAMLLALGIAKWLRKRGLARRG